MLIIQKTMCVLVTTKLKRESVCVCEKTRQKVRKIATINKIATTMITNITTRIIAIKIHMCVCPLLLLCLHLQLRLRLLPTLLRLLFLVSTATKSCFRGREDIYSGRFNLSWCFFHLLLRYLNKC